MSNPFDSENHSQSAISTTVPEEPTFDTLRSITRLIIGGVLLGLDEFQQRLPDWEREVPRAASHSDQGPPGILETIEEQQMRPRAPDTLLDQTRHALVGLVFESETRLRKGVATLGRMERATWKLMTPFHKPLRSSRVFAPARRRYERLVERGEAVVNHWVELGRAEERRSREVAKTALGDTVFDSIEQVVENPRLQNIVTERALTLSDEVADQVRERTVSADTLLESVARRLFRRAPREFPTEPPVTLQPPNRVRGE